MPKAMAATSPITAPAPAEVGIGRVLKGGEQKHRGLESLPQDRQERHPDEGGCGPRASASALALQLRLEAASVAPHPDDHVADHRHRDQADDRLEALLLALGELLADEAERDGHGDAHRHRQAHPQPHRPQRVATALLHQECRDDADDQRRLDALPQSDDQGGNQRGPPAVTVRLLARFIRQPEVWAP